MAAELRKGGEAHKVLDIAAGHGIFGISVAKQNPAAHIYAADCKAARGLALVEHSDGSLFVAGYGSPDFQKPQTVPRTWKSSDSATTWKRATI